MSSYSKEHYKEILFSDEKKKITVEETFNKQNNRVYVWSSKEAQELVQLLSCLSEECPMTVSLLYIFLKRALNYRLEILTNVVEPLK